MSKKANPVFRLTRGFKFLKSYKMGPLLQQRDPYYDFPSYSFL